MLVMRPAQMADLNEVQRLAADSPIGVTSLPDDVERLSDKIALETSFAAEVSFNGEEASSCSKTRDRKLVGCSAIVASAGYSEPFYSFRNETFVHASRELKIHNKIHFAVPRPDRQQPADQFLCAARAGGFAVAELNSRGRLLFVASHPERFADSVVTEIVGYSDEMAIRRWEPSVATSSTSTTQERLCGLKSRTFLAELMPHYPIYVPLLPDGARSDGPGAPAGADHLRHPDARRLRDRSLHRHLRRRPDLHARVSGSVRSPRAVWCR
jgi:arginine N-succinyltransferase